MLHKEIYSFDGILKSALFFCWVNLWLCSHNDDLYLAEIAGMGCRHTTMKPSQKHFFVDLPKDTFEFLLEQTYKSIIYSCLLLIQESNFPTHEGKNALKIISCCHGKSFVDKANTCNTSLLLKKYKFIKIVQVNCYTSLIKICFIDQKIFDLNTQDCSR